MSSPSLNLVTCFYVCLSFSLPPSLSLYFFYIFSFFIPRSFFLQPSITSKLSHTHPHAQLRAYTRAHTNERSLSFSLFALNWWFSYLVFSKICFAPTSPLWPNYSSSDATWQKFDAKFFFCKTCCSRNLKWPDVEAEGTKNAGPTFLLLQLLGHESVKLRLPQILLSKLVICLFHIFHQKMLYPFANENLFFTKYSLYAFKFDDWPLKLEAFWSNSHAQKLYQTNYHSNITQANFFIKVIHSVKRDIYQ